MIIDLGNDIKTSIPAEIPGEFLDIDSSGVYKIGFDDGRDSMLDVIIRFFPDAPCNYNGMDYLADDWCTEHCGEATVKQCWRHAIGEEWYNKW